MTFATMARNSWNGTRWTAAGLAAALALTAGCTRRTAVSHDFGLPNSPSSQKRISKAPAGSPPAARKGAPSPDEALREVFKQQAQGAFDPLTDDRRVKLIENRLRLNPQDMTARLELAGIYERYRLYEEALEQYTQALKYLSESPAAAGVPLRETVAAGFGRAARAAGRSSEAVPALAAFVRRSPSAGTWNEMGILYDEVGDRAGAEESFRQAVGLQPDSDRLRNNLGYNLLLQNKLEAAEGEFRRTLELNPKSATARNNLGAVLARRGDLENARQQFRLAAPDASTAYNNLAVVLLEMGDYKRSRDELVKALSARHYFAPALANFKLVQELLRQRATLAPAGGNLPLSTARIPPGLVLALSSVAPPVEQDRRLPEEGGAASNVSEDRP